MNRDYEGRTCPQCGKRNYRGVSWNYCSWSEQDHRRRAGLPAEDHVEICEATGPYPRIVGVREDDGVVMGGWA